MLRFALYVTGLVTLLGLTITNGQALTYFPIDSNRLAYAKEIHQKAISEHDSLLLAEAWFLYGKMYGLSGNYRTSQAYFLKSLRIQEPRGDSYELSRLYYWLSENERRYQRYKEALNYANHCLQVAQRIRSDKALVRAYGGLGMVYESIWNGQRKGHEAEYRRIIACYQKGLNLCYKLNDTEGIAESSVHLGSLFSSVNDPQAIPYFKRALHIFTLKDKGGIRVKTMVHLAEAYVQSKQYNLAGQLLTDAEKLYARKKLNDYDVRILLESTYVLYCNATGQWRKAFDHLSELNRLQRNQLLADSDGAIRRLNVEYETEKKETILKAQKKEINLTAQNLRLQQLFTRGTFALFVIATGMSAVFFRLYRKNQRMSHRNAELVKEQNHRVKNNLQVVASLLSLQSKRLTDPIAKKAVEESRLRVQSMAILHQRLYDGGKLAEVDLQDFIQEVVRGVLKAYGYPTITTRFEIEKIILSANKAVPLGLIVNELITNACKYAFPDNNAPELAISCYRTGKKIELVITDNGPGLQTAKTVKSGSFGMQLIQSQVDQLDGTCQFRDDTEEGKSGVLFAMEFNV
ncbi:sensor histidine kinase [Spirosoma litoris]